jgi:glucose-6-phosphate 1-epimerase
MASCTASLVAPALRVSGARRSGARRASRGPVQVRAASSVEEFAGTGDLPAVRLTAKNGDTATAYLFGGVVTSFVKSGRDVLYVRPDAVFDKSKPISGGLPHCWPQFGPGDIQVHGFARNVDWALDRQERGRRAVHHHDPAPLRVHQGDVG